MTGSLVTPLIDLLARLLNFLGCWVLWAIQTAFNGLVLGLAAAAAAAVAILPDFPALPDWSGIVDNSIVAMAAWLIPLGFMISWLAVLAGLWLAVQGALIALRWVKAAG